MSLFPRHLGYSYPEADSLTPLFRLLDDFDTYRNDAAPQGKATSHLTKSFNPKFDVKEVEDHYELHGELPGTDQKDIEIEFTDQQTLSIKGHSERSYQSGTPPDRLLGAGQEQGKITEAEPSHHKASVADESEEQAKETGQVAKTGGKKQQRQEPTGKFWVSERSVGEFARSFHFPNKVDQEGVKASMKDGILSIFVPKAKEVKGGKRIIIS